ncbi:uncharacterized protein BDZ99DRAFT_475412 [Mytilinidion resinicola]|uniref:DNA-directed RNA polymerase III subunit RPC3 n=1 Tax=Mytilinidion resinicola TaxID=574789 RepID=A0A6A6YSZ1_9PEZI|nr:uncharacterized protein BDZ99DRAFT_475412 [Mytilinidion resinicola]KAF2811930.1 hypothetical protein BDZ99DRAFT_475412 [Mytilinidion resinicola]
MSKNVTELCTLLVEKEHGELAADVFSTVAHVGRQHLAGLIRASRLPTKHFRHGLATLLQFQLVLQSELDEVTFYEVSCEHAHNLARLGKIARLVEARYGQEAGEIVTTLLNSGHAKVSDLAAAYGRIHKKVDVSSTLPNGTMTKHEGVNGQKAGTTKTTSDDTSNDDSAGNGGEVGSVENSNGVTANGSAIVQDKPETYVESDAEMHAILHSLLKAGWIVPVDQRDFWPLSDQRLDAEAWVLEHHFEKGKPPKGPKQVQALKRHLKHRMRQLRDQALDFSTSSIQTGSKRPATFSALPPAKRARANGVNGASHSKAGFADDDGVLLDGNLVVRISPEKVSVAMRTEQLVRLANRFIGETTSKVYRAFLQLLEEQTPRCYDQYKADPDPDSDKILIIEAKASVLKIAEVLDKSVDLYDGLAETPEFVNGNTNHDGDTLVNRGKLVEKHIKMLSEDPRHLATWASSRGVSEWYVEFPRLSRYLIQNQIEETVQSRFERLGMRLLRLLHNKGKLDEKQVASLGMCRPKEIRPILSQMQAAGFLDLQEIPKDNSRHPSRTIFLWFYDQDRVRRLLLEDAYKAMARILQRIEIERQARLEQIEKAERTDVKGNEDKYLTKVEKQKLHEWSQIEVKLSVQLERVDDLVGILNDFLGP